MMKLMTLAVLLTAMLGSLVVAADGPMYGGTLRVALASEPGKLDMPLDTGGAATDVGAQLGIG
jgi:hypothetical protein